MRFHGGTMDEPLGRRASFADWTFVACIGELEGRPPSSHGLAQHLASGTVPAVLRRAIAEKYDAAWVRARLPRVYHPGAGCWLEFACDRGEVSLRETEE